MSKPTFLQSVLGRPSRSYADHGSGGSQSPGGSPTKYTASSSMRSLSRRNIEEHSHTYGYDAGPSDGRRRQPHSTLGIGSSRHVHTHAHARDEDADSALGYARSDLGIGLPPGSSPYAPAGSSRRRRIVSDAAKTSAHPQIHVPRAAPDGPYAPPYPPAKDRPVHAYGLGPADPALAQPLPLDMPLPLPPQPQFAYPSPPSSVSSRSRPGLPRFSPIEDKPERSQRHEAQRHEAQPTPLAPVRILPSALSPEPGPPPRSKDTAKRRSIIPKVVTQSSSDAEPVEESEQSDSDDDVFYTPRSSFDHSRPPDADFETPTMELPSLPTFRLQPPTPLSDPMTPPLEKSLAEQLQTSDESLTPDYEPRPRIPTEESSEDEAAEDDTPVQKPQVLPPAPKTVSAKPDDITPPPVPPKSPKRTMSRMGRVRGAEVVVLQSSGGTRSTGSIKHSASTKALKHKASKESSRPPSRAVMSEIGYASRRPSGGSGASVTSEGSFSGSYHGSHNGSYNGSYPGSYNGSHGGSHPGSVNGSQAGSVSGVRRAGYGKGGWAAASAAPVVMYMPSEGSDGWAAFQPLPPRSRFDVLPPSRVGDKYTRHPGQVRGSTESSSIAPSASASQEGRYRSASPTPPLPPLPPPLPQKRYEPSGLSHSNSASPLSSQGSEDDSDGGQRPSRSYLGKASYNHGSDVGSNSQAPSTVKYDDTQQQQQQQQQRGLTPNYDPYNDPRTVAPDLRNRRQSLPALVSVPPSLSSSSLYTPSVRDSIPPVPPLPTNLFRSDSARINLDRPSSINPDLITFLPEMTPEASDALYKTAEVDRPYSRHVHFGSDGAPSHRARSIKSVARMSMSDVNVGSRSRRSSFDSNRTSTYGDSGRTSTYGSNGVIKLDNPGLPVSSAAIIDQSELRGNGGNGYTTLVLPKATNSTPALGKFDARLTGLPHSSMTAITLSSSLMSTKERHESPTPVHLRQNLSPPVDFTSHVPPPTKVGNSQLLVQVYAAAVDVSDITALEDKVTADVGKWIPGRSFVGRALVVGQDEESIHRGDIVIGLSDIKKSGALCEYILIDRRRVARIDPTHLTLEQMALLPSQGITALRAISGVVAKGARALVMDADRGVAALIAQAMARQGVHVTAVVAEGTEEEEKEAEARAHAHGASSVLVGTPTSALATLAASSLHVVVDTHGGSRVADAARRALVEGGHVLALCGTKAIQPPNGLRAAFSRRRTAVTVTPIAPAGTGEPAVDIAGLDCRDVLEEPALADLRPVVDPARVVPFERGADVFVRGGVVRIIN